jgi:hypothetical protein
MEIGLVKSPQQHKYMTAAKKMYSASVAIAKETHNADVYTNVKKANNDLVEFCKNNNIGL